MSSLWEQPPRMPHRWALFETWEEYHERFMRWHDEVREVERRNDERRLALESHRDEQPPRKRPDWVSAGTLATAGLAASLAPGGRGATTDTYSCPRCGAGFSEHGAFALHFKDREAEEEAGGSQGKLHEPASEFERTARRLELDYEQRPYRADPDHIRRHALEQREDLLLRRDEILSADRNLLGDEERVRHLRLSRPNLGERILDAARFELRALRIAEGETPKKETEAEWRARQSRLVERRLQDAMVRKTQELAFRRQIEQFLDERGLTDPAERERHLQEMLRTVLPEPPRKCDEEPHNNDRNRPENEDIEILGS